MLERSKQLTTEDIAAVEKLTAELNEFTALCGRIRAEMDELYFQALVSVLADAANANDGVAK
jgi:hypothetical protein